MTAPDIREVPALDPLREIAAYEAQFEYAMREGKYLEAASLIHPDDPFRDSKRLRLSGRRAVLDPDPRSYEELPEVFSRAMREGVTTPGAADKTWTYTPVFEDETERRRLVIIAAASFVTGLLLGAAVARVVNL